jgi:hypothetical protein
MDPQRAKNLHTLLYTDSKAAVHVPSVPDDLNTRHLIVYITERHKRERSALEK